MRIARYFPRLICNVLIVFFQPKIYYWFLKRFLLIVGFLCIHIQLPAEHFNSFHYFDYNNCNSSIFHKDQLPIVITGEPVDITTNSATVAGKVGAGKDDISERIFYWSTKANSNDNILNIKSLL